MLSTSIVVTGIAVFGIALLILGTMIYARKSTPKNINTINPQLLSKEPQNRTLIGDNKHITFEGEQCSAIASQFLTIAFGEPVKITELLKVHTAIFQDVLNKPELITQNPKYFPRKPLIIPQLMRAIRSDDSTRQELTNIIASDISLTASVLRIANSPFYRISPEPIDSISKAIVVMGLDGLRALLSSAVLQPAYQTNTGPFPQFSSILWERAVSAALASQNYARKSGMGDSFTAHLSALVYSLGHITLFKYCLDCYIAADQKPNASTISAFLKKNAVKTSRDIAVQWQLGDDVISCLDEYANKTPVDEMTPLTQALYYGNLLATMNILVRHRRWKASDTVDYLSDRGLAEKLATGMQKTFQPAPA